MTAVTSDDVSRLYDDFYRFLSSCGVDGVKADAQCLLDALTSAPARKDLTRSYLDAWSVASLRHFGTNATSCMALVPQVIFRSLVPCNRPPFACRTSDDFQPGNEAAHGWHVWINAFNGILARHLNVVPDWDMFQTVGAFAGFHAAARCLSGGPVYITDVPGEHDLELIEEMTAMTTRGRTVILRPSVPAKAIDPYVSYHDDILLKIGGYNGKDPHPPSGNLPLTWNRLISDGDSYPRHIQRLLQASNRAPPPLHIPRCRGAGIHSNVSRLPYRQ